MIHTLRELAHYTLGRKRLKLYVIRLVLTQHLIIAGAQAQSTMCGCSCTKRNTHHTHTVKTTLSGDLLELGEVHLLFILS